MSDQKIILLPGLGADRRLLEPTTRLIPGAQAVDLPLAGDDETFATYAVRVVTTLLADGATIVGGFSFGGMIALEAARDAGLRSQLAGIVLLASCPSKDAISAEFKRQAKMAATLPAGLLGWGLRNVMPGRFQRSERLSDAHTQTLREMARDVSTSQLIWGASSCADWDFPGPTVVYPELPILHLHGEQDRVIPGVGENIVWHPEAGHFLTWTHADWCASQIQAFAHRVSDPQ